MKKKELKLIKKILSYNKFNTIKMIGTLIYIILTALLAALLLTVILFFLDPNMNISANNSIFLIFLICSFILLLKEKKNIDFKNSFNINNEKQLKKKFKSKINSFLKKYNLKELSLTNKFLFILILKKINEKDKKIKKKEVLRLIKEEIKNFKKI